MAQPDQLEPLKEMVAATLEAPPPVLQSTATDAPVDVAEAPPEPPKARPPRPRAKPAAAAPQTPPAPLAPRAAIASPAVAAGPPPDYLASLRARLERAKIYPREAQMRGAQGVAHLQFVLDRSGRLLSFSIVRSSGHEALDREVEAMIHRAAPFPPLPVELASEKLAVLVPIEFSLR
jgi:protein TonB